MRTKRGFTLIELLVVMAIISILAAIAIPNVQKWIRRGRAVQAQSEIQNIELAITKMVSDAGRSNITDFFDLTVLETELGGDMTTWDAIDFQAATDRYTDAMYRLLRKGRAAADPQNTGISDTLFKLDVIRNLGTSYMTDLSFDPWGKLYQFYPGPWSTSRNGPVPFRVYLPPEVGAATLPGDDTSAVDGDILSLLGNVVNPAEVNAITLFDPETGADLDRIGIPADDRKDLFIWSFGENGVSGQALFRFYDPGYTDNSITNYDSGQEPELMGGGDDICNWDKKNQTYMRFYN